ncbi:M23 family metallopeptidase [Candidatus Saganbacteria bacterium]|nr:M23 family metallopeptidase [Candidatus Saganbacteria bacterium]
MTDKPKKQKFYTFVVISHDANGRTYSVKIPGFLVKTAALAAIAAIIAASGSVIYSSWLSRRMVNYYQTVAKNQEQCRVIAGFSTETAKVQKKIWELSQRENQLRKILGLKSWTSKIKLINVLDKEPARFSGSLKLVKLQLTEKETSLSELKKWVAAVQNKLAMSPSGWPLRGPIESVFGYRTSPWRGMHTGIDIQAPYGSAIRSTAKGIVSSAGWRRGYGKTVIVEHAYGQSTLYGHCSSLTVEPGQLVKKGQIIACVGMTGYTTGPHLHYEVRRAEQPVNPITYLNLNLLTASRIWSRGTVE